MNTRVSHRCPPRRVAGPNRPAPAARPPRRLIAVSSVALVAGLALLLSACGGSGTSQPAAAPSPTGTASSRAPGGHSAHRGAHAGTTGTVAAVSAASIEVRNPSSGQVTVDFSGSTRFTEIEAATLAAVRSGDCVLVVGHLSGAATTTRTITARSVRITPAGPAGCPAPARGVRSGRDRRGGHGARRTHSAPRHPLRAAVSASGRVTATTSTSLTLASALEVRRLGSRTRAAGSSSGPASSVASGPITVVVTSSTTVTRVLATSRAALAVGQCVVAIGPSSDSGTVSARSIEIRPAGSPGCAGSTPGAAGLAGSATGGSDV